jgi:hypothetical protein
MRRQATDTDGRLQYLQAYSDVFASENDEGWLTGVLETKAATEQLHSSGDPARLCTRPFRDTISVTRAATSPAFALFVDALRYGH